MNKVKFIETIAKMLDETEFSESVFFVYSDGVNWGVEIYKGEKTDLDESKVASMWWNIAMKNAYGLPPKPSKDLTFSLTFYKPREDRDISLVDKIEEMDKIFKTELMNHPLYTSLASD